MMLRRPSLARLLPRCAFALVLMLAAAVTPAQTLSSPGMSGVAGAGIAGTTDPTPPALQQALRQAAQQAEAGQFDVAEAQLIGLTRSWPQRSEPLLNLAALASRRGDAARARAHLEAAVRGTAAQARAYDLLQQLNAELARNAYARALAPSTARSVPAPLPWQFDLMQPLQTAPSSPASFALPEPTSAPTTATATIAAAAGSEPIAAAAGATASAAMDPVAMPNQAASTEAAVDLPQMPAAAASVTGGEGRSAMRWVAASLAVLLLAGTAGGVWARRGGLERLGAGKAPAAEPGAPAEASAFPAPTGVHDAPEARLITIYRLIGQSRLPEALAAAEQLARDAPHFGLAQLTYGDLLLAQTGALVEIGEGPGGNNRKSGTDAQSLRREALLRLQALRELPPAGSWPLQVLQLAPSVRHFVVVDTSRSRLYVFENRPDGPRLLAHHYISIGNLGVGKRNEGDQRTPLGVYYITARLDGKQLGDFYGAGALPLNYPNDHDRRLGRTGANIWLHGTPSDQYARAPRASNGCIVLSNDDLARWLRELAPRQTPVIVQERVEWVAPKAQATQRQTALALVEGWRRARMQDDSKPLLALYSQHFDNGDAGYDAWREQLQSELQATRGRERQLDDLSVLAWQEREDVLIVTFTEVLRGTPRGLTRRQYWSHDGGQWKIFSEGVLE